MATQVPVECNALKQSYDDLNEQLSEKKTEYAQAPAAQKAGIQAIINLLAIKLQKAEDDLNACIIKNTLPPLPPAPEPTKPNTSTDTNLVTKTKYISLDFLQSKLDEFFNKRQDPPIFKIRFDSYRDNNDYDNPVSYFEVLFIDAEWGYKQISESESDPGYGFYFNDINSNKITASIDTTQPMPIKLQINFEVDNPPNLTGTSTFEMPNKHSYINDVDFIEFYIWMKFTLNYDSDYGKIDVLSWISDIENMNVQINPTYSQPIHVTGKFLGADVNQSFTSIDEFKYHFFEQAIHATITTASTWDLGGSIQKGMKKKFYEKLVDQRDSINAQINRYLLGGAGDYKITAFSKNNNSITITYEVPQNILFPFDPITNIPTDWPNASTNPDSVYDFSPGNLANIDHIVVLMMENRSFDHLLGYLSLPVKDGGMGRTDIDGLKGGESNPFNGINYKSFAFPHGATKFSPDPDHGYEPVFHQINGGKMDGFVRSYADKAGHDVAGNIMGYHTAANVPVYDALVRDFAVCHRWFAAHPGPTFSNRFYELSGRLNMVLYDPDDSSNIGKWEFSNSKHLTPVFTKTIFDYLTEYQHITNGINWNYFEYYYCFLRFFEQHTFDDKNIVNADDPLNGFLAKAKSGTLPSVSFIDPHFIELPPKANCDGPPADIKDGQIFVQKIVEAVVTSPNWNKTLLIITYDEHGGFYDHVAPPTAAKVSPESPINTFGVRVPTFIISPWVSQGSVFGHDSSITPRTESLYFDHTSILKTIARRFMSDYPPYMGARYTAAKDLSLVIGNTLRQTQFLPFIRYNIIYNASQKSLHVKDASAAPGTMLWQYDVNNTDTDAQNFSFEDAGDGYFYIRTHCGNLYVTVDVPPLILTTNAALASTTNYNIKQDIKYKEDNIKGRVMSSNPNYQKWKLAPVNPYKFGGDDLFIISNVFFTDKVLQPINNTQSGVGVILGNKASTRPFDDTNAWKISSPLINHQIIVK